MFFLRGQPKPFGPRINYFFYLNAARRPGMIQLLCEKISFSSIAWRCALFLNFMLSTDTMPSPLPGASP